MLLFICSIAYRNMFCVLILILTYGHFEHNTANQYLLLNTSLILFVKGYHTSISK